MRADVAAAAGGTRLLRINPPRGLLLAGLFQLRGQPALGVPGLNLAHLADGAAQHQLAGQHNHRVAGVGIGHAEGGVVGLGCGVKLAGFIQRERERLFTQHAEAFLGSGQGRAEVLVVGGDDGHIINPVAG